MWDYSTNGLFVNGNLVGRGNKQMIVVCMTCVQDGMLTDLCGLVCLVKGWRHAVFDCCACKKVGRDVLSQRFIAGERKTALVTRPDKYLLLRTSSHTNFIL